MLRLVVDTHEVDYVRQYYFYATICVSFINCPYRLYTLSDACACLQIPVHEPKDFVCRFVAANLIAGVLIDQV